MGLLEVAVVFEIDIWSEELEANHGSHAGRGYSNQCFNLNSSLEILISCSRSLFIFPAGYSCYSLNLDVPLHHGLD